MTALLAENLPLLAGAPNGIKKLRELILELAVRGKLVPQDSNDEPASELLKSIAAEQARLMVEEGLRTKAQADVPQKDQYLQVSAGWAYSRLGNLARFIDYRGRTPIKTDSGIPLITAKNVRVGFISREPQEFISKDDYSSWMTRGFPRLGDVLFTTEAPMGNVALVNISEKFALAQRIICFQLHDLSIGPFLKLAMMSTTFQKQLLEVATGMTATGVKSSRLKEIPVPLPPLAEQHRIVAKVDELMALCNQLEAQQADAETAHSRLVRALLDSLTYATDGKDFAANWQRLAEHFHTLFTTEGSIDAIKQTLLQLAVMGKLVLQDPSDEPVCELLKRIESEKQQVVQVGRVKSDKLLPLGAQPSKLFAIPCTWSWVQLGQITISGPSNGFSPKPATVETNYRCLTLSATTRGMFNGNHFKFVDITDEIAQKYHLKNGDLLIQRANSIDYVGVSAIYDGADDYYIYPDLMMKLKISSHLNSSFLHAYLSSNFGREYFKSNATGTQGNMPKINQGTVVSAPIPIPPIAEQHRIVTKLNQLLALCDLLKSRLIQAHLINEQLSTNLAKHAIN